MFRFTFAFSIVLLCSVARLHAQSSADPLRAALLAATQKAALESEGSPPFHLEAKYETFDYTGQPLGSGTLTEEFLRPGLHKLTVHEGGSADVYAPEDQARIGDPVPASTGNFMERLLVEMLLHPGPTSEDIQTAPLKEKNQKLGDVSLRCITVQLSGKSPRGTMRTPQVYCLSPDAPILRIAVQRYGMEVLYNRIGNFAGHTVAQDITVRQGAKVRGRLQVTKLAGAPTLKEADFEAESAVLPTVDRLSGGTKLQGTVATGQMISKVAPIYPSDAKAKHISGQVLLHAIISKEGTIEDLEVISAPAEDLAEAAVDAVSQWRYKPYTLDGKPTEVDTTVTVNFSFGR